MKNKNFDLFEKFSEFNQQSILDLINMKPSVLLNKDVLIDIEMDYGRFWIAYIFGHYSIMAGDET